MCGINGIIGDKKEAIRAMNRATAHRGPDQTNSASSPDCTLGHNRLSIVDLTETGSQPMTTQSGRYTIVYNGEVYNAAPLRQELSKLGITFRGSSDTEVILYAYETWGPTCVDRFRGMWAFAVYDRESKNLFLSRDHFGIKPLYLYRDKKTVAFSSEIRGLLALPEVERTMDPEAVRDLVFLGYIVAPKTILKNARAILPGETVMIDVKNGTEKCHISKLEAPAREAPSDEELKAALIDSVRHHLIADVPVGLFFSGGIDSSILALTLKEMDVRMTAFHIGVPGRADGAYAKAIAEQFNINLKPLNLSTINGELLLEDLFASMDEPLGDSSLMPTLAVSKLAANEVKVVLSGEGGDELFGGYPRARRLAGLAADTRRSRSSKALAALIRSFFPLQPHRFPLRLARGALRRLETIRGDALGLFLTETATSSGLVDAHTIRVLVRERLKDRELPDRGLAFDRLISLPDELLLKADTATMAYSIEGRVPFLDRELFKLVGGAPNNWKRQGHTGKVPLRQILKTRLPKELVNRPKEGFSFSVSKFMQEYAPEKLKGALAWYQENYRGALPAIDASLKEALGKGKLREMLTVLGYSYYAIFILSDFVHRHRLTF